MNKMFYTINKLYNFNSDTDYNILKDNMVKPNCHRTIEVMEDGKKYIIIRQKVNGCLIDWLIPLEE